MADGIQNTSENQGGRTGDTPLAVLSQLAFPLMPKSREEFLNNFRPVRLPQPEWVKKLVHAAQASQVSEVALPALDLLSLHGNPHPLAYLVCTIPPAEIESSFGVDPLLWACIVRTVSGEEDHVLQHPVATPAEKELSQFERLRWYLLREWQVDVSLLDSVARASYRYSAVADAAQTLSLFKEVRNFIDADCLSMLHSKIDSVNYGHTQPLVAVQSSFDSGREEYPVETLRRAVREIGLPDVTLGSLEQLSARKDPQPLAQLICSLDPALIDQEFGVDPLIWGWLNRSVCTAENAINLQYRNIPDFERLPRYLERRHTLDLGLLDSIARGYIRQEGRVLVGATLNSYFRTLNFIEDKLHELSAPSVHDAYGALPRSLRNFEHLMATCLREGVISESNLKTFKSLQSRLSDHSPKSLRLEDLEGISKRDRDPTIFHSLIKMMPPEIIHSQLGPEAHDVLLWGVVNCTSIASRSHHSNRWENLGDISYPRMFNFYCEQYQKDPYFLHQAQITAWGLSNASIDIGLIQRNYELFELMRNFDFGTIPLQSILERYRYGKFPRDPENYGLCPLEVYYTRVEGADIQWANREVPWAWENVDSRWSKAVKNYLFKRCARLEYEDYVRQQGTSPEQEGDPKDFNTEDPEVIRLIKARVDDEYRHIRNSFVWRQFCQTVRCDSPRGLALTYQGYPIAIISFHIGQAADGSYQFTCGATQGVRVELWCGEKIKGRRSCFHTFPTPHALGKNFFEILTEMSLPLAKQMGLPWVHLGSRHSNWLDKVPSRRLEERLSNATFSGGVRLEIDEQGNWRFPS
jgi:hypothetical protein